MHRYALLVVFAVGCSRSEPLPPEGPTTKVTKEAIDKAKAKITPPLPVADARKKFVEELGEPTATEDDNLIWAGVSGSQCNEVKMIVQGGEAKGTIGTSVNKIVQDEFAKCRQHAGTK